MLIHMLASMSRVPHISRWKAMSVIYIATHIVYTAYM